MSPISNCLLKANMAGNYSKDDWTERLFHCLNFKGEVKAELTCCYRCTDVAQSWNSRLPRKEASKYLLFRGSPDMIIKKKNIDGILGTDSKSDGNDVNQSNDADQRDNGDQNDDGDDLPSSQESGKLQMGHQMTCSSSYYPNSILTNKVGELVVAVHTSIACQAPKLYLARKPVTVLKGHGLHIHRALGIYHIVVTVSDKDKMNMQATQLVDGFSTPGILCSAITYFIGQLDGNS